MGGFPVCPRHCTHLAGAGAGMFSRELSRFWEILSSSE